MATVKQLIEFLQTQQQDLPVAYRLYSEQVMLDLEDVSVEELCVVREDGWIQNKRPDMHTQKYLLLPGN